MIPTIALRPSQLVIAILLVVAVFLGLRGRAAVAERDAARVQAAQLQSTVKSLQEGVAAANAGVERLEAQGREIQRSVDRATGQARELQRQTAAHVEAVLKAQNVPQDATGALSWAHASAAAAAQDWEASK